jgi:2-haloalkanoic acid dehalogenase type II
MANKFKAVLFDLGGTLVHFDGAWHEVMQAATVQLLEHLQGLGFKLDGESFLNEFQQRLEEYYVQREAEFIEYTTARILRDMLFNLGNKEVTIEMLAPALERLYAVSQAHWKPEPDADKTLKMLKQAGLQLAVISNAGDDADVQTLVNNSGLRPYLDFALSSAACGIRKPNPLIFKIALEQWALHREDVIMVGDTLGADILGARNAGITSVWITRRADTPANRDHLDTIKPDFTISALAELPNLVRSFAGGQAIQLTTNTQREQRG